MRRFKIGFFLVTCLLCAGCQSGPLASFSKSTLGEPMTADSSFPQYQKPGRTLQEMQANRYKQYQIHNSGVGYRRGSLPCRT